MASSACKHCSLQMRALPRGPTAKCPAMSGAWQVKGQIAPWPRLRRATEMRPYDANADAAPGYWPQVGLAALDWGTASIVMGDIPI